MKEIIISEYDENWNLLFEEEKALLTRILPINNNAIHHIGSTSVSGLASKPIIDILIEVDNIKWLDQFDSIFELHQYECMGEFGINGRRYYRKGKDIRTHQIHAFTKQSHDVIRHIAFKEYLKVNSSISKEYSKLKKLIAKQSEGSMEIYCDGKEPFVKEHESKALAWFNKV